MTPPPLPRASVQSTGVAALLNAAVPGVGLYFLGRRKLGVIIATLFLACFAAVIALFVIYYARYISLATSDDLFQGDKLERHGALFPTAWLIGLAAAGGAIHLVSMMLLRQAKRRADGVHASACSPPAAKA